MHAQGILTLASSMDVNVGIFLPSLNIKADCLAGYCGNTINPGGGSAPVTDCSFFCPGDQSEDCGAGARLESPFLIGINQLV
jgi:hypothetical protein